MPSSLSLSGFSTPKEMSSMTMASSLPMTESKQEKKPKASLLGIPPELRLLIYEALIPQNTLVDNRGLMKTDTFMELPTRSLYLICKTIREEARTHYRTRKSNILNSYLQVFHEPRRRTVFKVVQDTHQKIAIELPPRWKWTQLEFTTLQHMYIHQDPQFRCVSPDRLFMIDLRAMPRNGSRVSGLQGFSGDEQTWKCTFELDELESLKAMLPYIQDWWKRLPVTTLSADAQLGWEVAFKAFEQLEQSVHKRLSTESARSDWIARNKSYY